ncbi:MAG: DUF2095 family protein [Promethearchaeota archaeon]
MGSKRKPSKKETSEIPLKLEKEVKGATDSECEDLTERILEHLPNLANEMKTSEAEVQIDGVRWEETDRTRQPVRGGEDRFSGYSPDVIDFLRRCATDDEALEIISFLEKRGEINSNHAEELRKQLQNQGLRSFGTKKSWGHYERESS